MKRFLLFFVLIAELVCPVSDVWTPEQIAAANTAVTHPELTKLEKETIMYLNLARLYPKQFAVIEVRDYWGTDNYPDYLKTSRYKQSLIDELIKREAVQPLYFDKVMYASAVCFSKESGRLGTVGHTRKQCTIPKGVFAECCSYGMSTAKDIVLQLLIDDEIEGVGHRVICLDKKYSKIGVSISSHKVWDT
ncbi:hypothetical protein, partial [Flavihumibacter sp. CACIAM 22H1]|uniref:hypothetical protein n=1 Tax=Flavihumibacter sp. CACIAM 22H1 TaxID=1812911 RepID=UPI0007A7CB78